MSSHSHPTTTISTRQTPTDRKWFVSLQVKKNESTMAVTTATTNNDLILTPVGYSSERGIRDQVANEDGDRLFAKRSWDLATQPFKQLPMNMIFSWMAGSSLSLMSIMIVVMLFMKPIQVENPDFEKQTNKRIFLFLSQFFLFVLLLLRWNKKLNQVKFGYLNSFLLLAISLILLWLYTNVNRWVYYQRIIPIGLLLLINKLIWK